MADDVLHEYKFSGWLPLLESRVEAIISYFSSLHTWLKITSPESHLQQGVQGVSGSSMIQQVFALEQADALYVQYVGFSEFRVESSEAATK